MSTRAKSQTVPLCATDPRGCDIETLYQLCGFEPRTTTPLPESHAGGTDILSAGDHLIHRGEVLKSVYVVRSGSLKGYYRTEEGVSHVVEFFLPGDVIGIDALGDNVHQTSVQALEMTNVSRLAVTTGSAGECPPSKLHCSLMKLASQSLANQYRRMLVLGQRDAGARMAIFLLQLSHRYKLRGFSSREFNLSMSRRDIASYLALKVETVSRVFSDFQNRGLVTVKRRSIALQSLESLHQVAGQAHLLLVS